MKKIIINEDDAKNVVMAVMENGKAVEIYKKDVNQKNQEGNIYCGIVRNILPGMQSAFIDINENKNAFIHIKDILPKANNTTGNKEEKFEKYDINDYIKVGDTILVQAKKEEEGKKGARVSKHISLTGKYVVLMPEVEFITVSQKIENEEKKEELKDIIKEILPEETKYGVIVRTAAEFASKESLEEDINNLINGWKKILEVYEGIKSGRKPVKIFDNDEFISKAIIGLLSEDELEIVVNNKEIFEKVENIIHQFIGKKISNKVEENLLEKYEIDTELNKMQERKIWLKCGGFITIDKTEALTAIDVNSGKFVGSKKSDKEQTVYKVNKEATIEIARQLKLRNISGIIVVDYIDMEKDEDRKRILDVLSKEIKKDRSKVQIIGFTKLDLLEITRKKL